MGQNAGFLRNFAREFFFFLFFYTTYSCPISGITAFDCEVLAFLSMVEPILHPLPCFVFLVIFRQSTIFPNHLTTFLPYPKPFYFWLSSSIPFRNPSTIFLEHSPEWQHWKQCPPHHPN